MILINDQFRFVDFFRDIFKQYFIEFFQKDLSDWTVQGRVYGTKTNIYFEELQYICPRIILKNVTIPYDKDNDAASLLRKAIGQRGWAFFENDKDGPEPLEFEYALRTEYFDDVWNDIRWSGIHGLRPIWQKNIEFV